MGHSVCRECGEVLEENTIVIEASFSENSKGGAVADGVRVNLDSAWAGTRGGPSGSIQMNSQSSRELTIQNGYRRIAAIGTQMKMSERQIESAQRFFNLAYMEKFTKGRRSNNVASACLYIVCRQEKTSHMLIDFSENLRINVYVLGATFIRLVATLKLHDIPLVDPMLYIARFAAKLEFEDKYQDVVRDASRLVSRMDRDWIARGRRPSGICAACLFIAARMNGFRRSPRELVKVMKICEATLRKRLTDFKNTPSASLSVEDFQTLMLEECADPPSFTNSRRSKAIEGGESASGPLAITDGTYPIAHTVKRKRADDDSGFGFSPYPQRSYEEDEGFEEFDEDNEGFGGAYDADYDHFAQEDEEEFHTVLGSEELVGLATNEGVNIDEEVDDLEDLDDDIEIKNVELTEEEVAIKTQYWLEENSDWILKNAAKLKAEENGTGRKAKKPRKKRGTTSQTPAASAQEAAQALVNAKKNLSKKLNYDVVNNLFANIPSSNTTQVDAPMQVF
ncbi:cyclin-like protein [Chytridium lagenaria]|nr:cyclin-like protein [Chytridium lagenaria]